MENLTKEEEENLTGDQYKELENMIEQQIHSLMVKGDKECILHLLDMCRIFSIWDEEVAHRHADTALLLMINDSDISLAFKNIRKWYS